MVETLNMTMSIAKAQTNSASAFVSRLQWNQIIPVVCNLHPQNMSPCETVICISNITSAEEVSGQPNFALTMDFIVSPIAFADPTTSISSVGKFFHF